MIASECGFHNENDYSESDREMRQVICLYEIVVVDLRMWLIYIELIWLYNILTYRYGELVGLEI